MDRIHAAPSNAVQPNDYMSQRQDRISGSMRISGVTGHSFDMDMHRIARCIDYARLDTYGSPQ